MTEDLSRSGGEEARAGEPRSDTHRSADGATPEFTEVKNASASGLGSLEKSDENQVDSTAAPSGTVKD